MSIHDISYGGTGCPAGTASVVLTDDRLGFSTYFDQMSAEVGSILNRRAERKACTIRLSLEVLAGFQIKIRPLNIEGFVQVPIGGQALVETKTSYVG